jgi:predicted SprT family Zn-dependent metalloprotease
LHPHDAKLLARRLMIDHGLGDWTFQFDHAKRRFGCCFYQRRLITLSRPLTLLNDSQQVRDTILHEIAHALAPGDGHGVKWRQTCVRIGAQPSRCYNDTAVRSPARAPAKYLLGCRTCGWWIQRRRRIRSALVCRKCESRLVFGIRCARAFA